MNRPTMTRRTTVLFVAWQNPTTRRFYPVGRRAELEDDGGGRFEFAYIQGARGAEGFLPFLPFPDVSQVYRSDELFPTFSNRLLSRKRPDFVQYVEDLGLPAGTDSPLTILGRSLGRRATDTLELFPRPEFAPGYGYRTWFWAHGIRHIQPRPDDRIATLQLDEPVSIWSVPDNPVVPEALGIWTDDDCLIGYVPGYLLEDAYTLQNACGILQARVARLNPPPTPIQQRLLLRLDGCWPDRFVPYSTPRYQPISSDAATIPVRIWEEWDYLASDNPRNVDDVIGQR